ncbi:MATE family efflux transporter [Mucilaginibacter sp. RS28]|uniref:MATE family efflux transporter n=1 Tax=Mucilaginibacter straminoryzae TaxID=2932774 RepID=A0A9X1XA66_9SPHI|nr:MATE family efflux transporter [Mucilaginibacter straminoryzae]MCJ8211024.1 MATE family efflux transporter [Mucilaginibacter straminoryzae]
MNKRVLRWNFIFQYGYVITNIINSLILLPFYLHKIDASTLGVWLATGNILAWMTLIDPGVGDVLQQKIGELYGRQDKKEIEKTIGSGLIAATGILALAVVAGFVFYFLIGAIINKDVTQYPNLQIALFITIISTGMSLISFAVSGINQGLQNASHVAVSAILANVLFLVVNVGLLIMGYGIISIAFANLCRALFINIYNFSALKLLMKKEQMRIVFLGKHFKRFIKIFSFTSMSSIIGGLAASMDTIVLARFIAPSMITIFEINKRPVQLTNSMVGRHSVALMPVVSHASGRGDKKGILDLINVQFKYYTYAALFVILIFSLCYKDLLTVWAGKNKYAGDTILYLMLANFFFQLVGYFMQNMGYALGDIKMNSMVNIAKGIGIGVLYYPMGAHFGIIGILTVMLSFNVIVEFFYFSYRLYKLGYLQQSLIKTSLSHWIIVVPVTLIAYKGIALLATDFIAADQSLVRLLFTGAAGTITYAVMVMVADKGFRKDLGEKLSGMMGKLSKKNRQPQYELVTETNTL